jgi:hypothetical protein
MAGLPHTSHKPALNTRTRQGADQFMHCRARKHQTRAHGQRALAGLSLSGTCALLGQRRVHSAHHARLQHKLNSLSHPLLANSWQAVSPVD